MARITVTATATLLTPGAAQGDNEFGKSSLIKNTGSVTISVGNASDVTYATGFPLPVGETITADLTGGSLYGICDTGQSSEVAVLEIGVG
jgi:hypothetical protein